MIHERKEAAEVNGKNAALLEHKAGVKALGGVFGISEHDLLYSKDDADTLDAAVSGMGWDWWWWRWWWWWWWWRRRWWWWQ